MRLVRFIAAKLRGGHVFNWLWILYDCRAAGKCGPRCQGQLELRMDSQFAATIVIPLLDQVDEWLRQCVRSALMQTVRCEVVVVLSPITRQSNLDLLAALKLEFHNLRVLPRETMGFPGAINAGFKAASADRIGLLLSDDWLDPRAVEVCLGRMPTSSAAAIRCLTRTEGPSFRGWAKPRAWMNSCVAKRWRPGRATFSISFFSASANSWRLAARTNRWEIFRASMIST